MKTKCINYLFAAMFFLFTPFLSRGQDISLEWAKGIGGKTNSDYGYSVSLDVDGNVYLAGSFQDTVDFDPEAGVFNLISTTNSSNTFSSSVFIAKYTPTGNLIWAKALNNNGANSTAFSIKHDSSGHFYIGGTFANTLTFGTGANNSLTAQSSNAGFLGKYDTAGNLVWVRGFGTNSLNLTVSEIEVNENGSIYLTGDFYDTLNFFGTTTFLPALLTSTSQTAYLAKYNSSGVFQWAKHFGSTGNSQYGRANGLSLASDIHDNIYITGGYRYQVDLNPGTDSTIVNEVATNNIYFSKYNSNGDFIWGKSLQGGSGSLPSKIAVDKTNTGIFLIGVFNGTLDFDPSTTITEKTRVATVGSDLFISKYDSSGNHIWVSQISGGRNKEIGGIGFSNFSNDFYISGTFADSANFTPGTTNIKKGTAGTTSIRNGFLAKYNAAGEYQWAGVFSSAASAWARNNLTTDNASGIYVIGGFAGQTDYDPGQGTNVLTSVQGTIDIGFAKFTDGCPAITNLNEIACDSFSFAGTMLYASGQHADTFLRPGTCDSIVNLNLTINQSSYAPIVVGEYCDSISFNGFTYTTTGIYTQITTNVAGCDSILTYDITIKGQSQQTTINEISCGDYTFNGASYNVSGTYIASLQTISGCDSIVTLNLTVEPEIVASVIQNGATLIANGGDSYQWINCADNSVITGANGQQYTATINGSYAVVITSGSCIDTSDCIEITGLSINNYLKNNNKIEVYPNPTSAKINIQCTQALKNAEIKLVNVLGQIVFEKKSINDKMYTLDLSQYTNGVYMLEIIEQGEKVSIKISKQ